MATMRHLLPVLVLLSIAHGQTVLSGAGDQYETKIAGNDDGYPKDSNYLFGRVLPAAYIGGLIAITACLWGVFFSCSQCCAKCCKCCQCACCGTPEPDPAGYTRKQRLRLVGVLSLSWVVIIVGAALAYNGNSEVADGLDSLSDISTTAAQAIYDQVKMGYDSAVLLGENPDYQMVTDAQNLKDDIDDAAKQLKDTDEARVISAYVFYAFLMVIPCLGMISWWCGNAFLSGVMTQLSFFLLFIAWLFFALGFASVIILNDTCVEAGKQVYGEANELSELLECSDSTSSSQSTYDSSWLDTAQSTYATQGYSPAMPYETNYGFTCGSYTSACGVTNAASYQRNRDLLQAMYTDFGVTAASCESVADTSITVLCYVSGMDSSTYSSTCTGSNTQACLQQSGILASAAMVGTSYLISCEHLNYISLQLNNNVCDDMVEGLLQLVIGQTFVGVFYFGVLAVGCLGMNYFKTENNSERGELKQDAHDLESAKVAPAEMITTTEVQQFGVESHEQPPFHQATPDQPGTLQA